MAAVAGDHRTALDQARVSLGFAETLGMGIESSRWSWPIAARAALALGDSTALDELHRMLDERPIGRVVPLLRGELALSHARAGHDDDPDTAARYEAGLQQLREWGGPWHLGHGLLDVSEFYARTGREADAAALRDEAVALATRVGAQPVLARARSFAPAMRVSAPS